MTFKQQPHNFPKQQKIEKEGNLGIRKVVTGNLSEMSKFQPESDCAAFTPPDKNFMQNLLVRMEKS